MHDSEGYPTARSNVYTEYFARGTEPVEYCDAHFQPYVAWPAASDVSPVSPAANALRPRYIVIRGARSRSPIVSHLWDLFRRGSEVRRLTRRVLVLETKARANRKKSDELHAAVKRKSASRHRRILSPGIIHGLLPTRFATLQARATRANAGASEARLAQVSSAYREAMASVSGPAENLIRTDVQGVAWWVPAPRSLSRAARQRFVAKQRFPVQEHQPDAGIFAWGHPARYRCQ